MLHDRRSSSTVTPMNVDSAIGTPNERVTHWGISRVTGYKRNEKNKRTPLYDRMTHPRGDGVRINEWPLEECTLENIRERWGAGEYRTHWFILDPEAAEVSDRRASGGNGYLFTLDPEEEQDDTPTTAAVNVTPPGDGVTSQLDFAMRMMALSDERAHRSIQAIMQSRGNDGGQNAEILAKLAEMTARLDAERVQREIEQRHRDELAKKDEEIRELKRAKEKAEEEAEKKDDAPMFDPDVSIWEQLPVVCINAVTGLAKTHPEVAMSIMEKGAELWQKRKHAAVSRETPTPATGAAPTPAIPRTVAPQPAAPPRAPVYAVPPVRRDDDPLTPSQTAKAADPVPRAPVPPPQVAPQPSAE